MKALAALIAAGAVGLSVGPAQAAIVDQQWESYTLRETACDGDRVTINVRVHFVHREVETRNGYASSVHLNSVAGKATSDSGASYVFRDGSNSTGKNAFVEGLNGAQVFKSTIRLRLMRVGNSAPGDDLIFRAVHQYVVNANGEVTSQFDKGGEFLCR
jgi:hypothetical protein